MNADTLLVVFVGITALAMVLQITAVVRLALTAKQVLKKVDSQSSVIQADVQRMMERLDRISEHLLPLTEVGDKLQNSIDELSQMVKQRAEDLDQFVGEMEQTGRAQASKIDYVVTDTVQKFEQTTEVIQKDILRPAVEISSFFKGIKSGLEYLFSRRSRSSKETYPEEELFI